MNENFTPETLLLFIYGELNEKASIDVMEGVVCKPEVSEMYEEFVVAKNMLDDLHYAPKSSTLENVLAYAEF